MICWPSAAREEKHLNAAESDPAPCSVSPVSRYLYEPGPISSLPYTSGRSSQPLR